MELGLKNKVVIVTGGASGLGKAAAKLFLKEGSKVAVCGRNPQKLEAMKKECNTSELLVFQVDVTNNLALEHFADEVIKNFGRLDIWINNAGLSDPMPCDDADEAAFDRMVNINLRAVFFGSQIAAKRMRITNNEKIAPHGVILNTSSFTSIMPTAGKALYSATKAAVNSLTRSMAAEYAADNIRVVSVIPGYIRTEMTQKNIDENESWLVSNIASKRLGIPSDIASAFVYLASDAAEYITGTELIVSGGKYCVQNPMWSWER